LTHTVDAHAHWEVYSAPLPKPHNWFQGGFAVRGNKGGLLEKVAKGEAEEKLKGNDKREEKRRERGGGIAP